VTTTNGFAALGDKEERSADACGTVDSCGTDAPTIHAVAFICLNDLRASLNIAR
jgi:hypothetical protein